MIFKLSNYTLDIDVERTRAFYERADIPTTSEQCGCADCRNFDKAILKASASVVNFLRSLGIDPQKPAEIFNVTGEREQEGTIWYNGWYHICGTIVKGPKTVQKTVATDGSVTASYRWEQNYAPDPDFPFAILPISEIDLLHKDFPTPVIHLQFDTHLPFVLPIAFDN